MSLALSGVAVTIGRRDLVADVDLALRPGELLGLLGPNGAGKSTLLGVLAGDRAPSRGEASLDGRPLRAWRGAALAQRRAVMLQSAAIAFAYTAREIVELGRLPHAGRKAVAEDAVAIDEAMRRCDVAHLAARSYLTLSGGERQRVQLARAFAQIATRPVDCAARYLLLDEPTASLDLRHQHDALRQVRALLAPDLGACVVLHDVNLADAWCDRVALLKNGRLVAAGPTQEILTPALLTQVYDVPMRALADGGRRSFVVDVDAAA